jgi:glyoxylase-like metal-dependent hydrolase (beta-lactamase superfamily II)
MPVTELDPGLHGIDLEFQGLPGVIASYLLSRDGDHLLIETGPSTTLGALLACLKHLAVEPENISKLLVTHVHLDHAGAAGTLIQRYPHLQLYVHEIGAPHMIDPSKLLVSAGRIYGDQMGPLWGEVLPVPEENVHALKDESAISIGDRQLTAVYTPGHASHHVVYRDGEGGDVFTGDVAAVRLQGFDTIRPPTPPPDIDLEGWRGSLDRIEAMQAKRLLLTHFGPQVDVNRHLQQTRARLKAWASEVEHRFAAGIDRDQIVRDLQAFAQTDIAGTDDPTAPERYELATPTFMSADGLIRYFRKRGTAAH